MKIKLKFLTLTFISLFFSKLVFAETVEDVDEPVEDDIDTNKTADADGE